jgi:hypothetical protein
MTADGPDPVNLGQGPGYFLAGGGRAGTLFTRNSFHALRMQASGAPERAAALQRGKAERSLGRGPLPAGGIRFDPSLGVEDLEDVWHLAGSTAGTPAGVPAVNAHAMSAANEHAPIVPGKKRPARQDTPSGTLYDVQRIRKGQKSE